MKEVFLMMSYILISVMVFLILMKIIAMIKVSKDNFSSAIVRYWTIAPFKLKDFKELSREQQKIGNFHLHK